MEYSNKRGLTAEDLADQTVLTEREAEVWLMKQTNLTHQEIADELGISKSTVDGLAAGVRKRIKKARRTTTLVSDRNSLTRSKVDPTSTDFLGLEWGEWTPLDEPRSIPHMPGLYRVRHKKIDGLLYIGDTGRSLRSRIRSLKRVFGDEMPYRDPHTAGPCLYAVRQDYGDGLEVSISTPPISGESNHRLGVRDALIAVYRRENGESPIANFGNIIPGWEFSTHRSGGQQGGRSEDGDNQEGTSPREWKDWRDVGSHYWCGFEWYPPRPLKDRSEVSPSNACLYRIMPPAKTNTDSERLEYIGQTSDLRSRLLTHERNLSGDFRFSFAELTPSESESTLRQQELETDLLGAHYLALGVPPTEQYGGV